MLGTQYVNAWYPVCPRQSVCTCGMHELKELPTCNKRIYLDNECGSLGLTQEHFDDFATMCATK